LRSASKESKENFGYSDCSVSIIAYNSSGNPDSGTQTGYLPWDSQFFDRRDLSIRFSFGPKSSTAGSQAIKKTEEAIRHEKADYAFAIIPSDDHLVAKTIEKPRLESY